MSAHKAYSGGGIAAGLSGLLFLIAYIAGIIELNQEQLMGALSAIAAGMVAIGVGTGVITYRVPNKPKTGKTR